MKNVRYAAISLILLIICLLPAGIVAMPGCYALEADESYISDSGRMPAYVPNEIIVKFKKETAGLTPSLFGSVNRLNKKHKVKEITPLFKNFKKHNKKKDAHILRRLTRAPQNAKIPALERIYKLELQEGGSVEDAVAGYNKDPNVEYAQPNYILSINAVPDDPLYSAQWALNNTGQDYPASGRYNHPPGTPDCDIDAPEAWDASTGSQDIIVAVIDTGVDYNHPDIKKNIWINKDEIPANGIDDDGNGYADDYRGWDFYSFDKDPKDDHGHGTHCAGIIAAEGNNSYGITGICWTANIMPVKFLNSSGSGSTSGAINAVYYAVDNGADILSNSWGGGAYNQALKDAIDYAYANGVIFVAAAGNSNSDATFYPACYDNVFAVAATDSNDKRASFSNYGPWIDVAAPGVDILSLRAEDTYMGAVQPDGETTIASGTSMACPHVAGVAAQVLTINPGLNIQDIANYIISNADNITTDKPSISKRINLSKTLINIPLGNFCHITKVEFTDADSIDIFSKVNIPGLSTVSLKIRPTGSSEWANIPAPPPATIPVNSEFIIATYNTNFIECPYELALECHDPADNLYHSSFVFEPDNFRIDSLENELHQDIGFLNGGLVNIRATMLGNNFVNFSLQYGKGRDPQTWLTNGITILHTSGTCEDKIIATLDTSCLDEDGYYTVRLNGIYSDFTTSDTRYFYYNKDMHAGWPKIIPKEAYGGAYAVDVNGDGLKEIITFERGGIYVWGESGNLLTKWVNHGTFLDWTPLSFADIDATPGAEVVYHDTSSSYQIGVATFRNGTFNILPGWPKNIRVNNMSATLRGDIVIDDVDGDGDKDIVCIGGIILSGSTSAYYKVFIFNSDGTEFNPAQSYTYSRTTPPDAGSNRSNPFVCLDLNGDGKKEIIVASYDHNPIGVYPVIRLDAWKTDGTAYQNGGWPIIRNASMKPRAPICEILSGDVNKDGEEEIIFNALDGTIGIVNKQGSFLYGTPVKFTAYDYLGSSTMDRYLSLALCDLEQDGYLEIATSIEDELHVLNYDGTEREGWPVDLSLLYPPIPGYSHIRRFMDISIGDVNGDYVPDIVCGTSIRDYIGGVWNGYKYLMAFDMNGNEVKKWKSFGYWHKIQYRDYAAQLADIDNDGKLEMLFVDDGGKDNYSMAYVSVWDLDSPGDSSTVDWPRARRNLNRTGHYSVLPDTRPPSVVIVAPLPYADVSAGGFEFRGTAEDSSSVTEVRIDVWDAVRERLTVDNEPANYDPVTHQWNFQVLSDHVTAGDSSAEYNAILEVKAKDALANERRESVYVNVRNHSPVVAPVDDKTACEDQLLQFTVMATDADNDQLNFTIEGSPDSASFVDNSNNTATFSWTPSWWDAGIYNNVRFIAADAGGLSDSKIISITVEDTIREIRPGESIQSAIDNAGGGSNIYVADGVYESDLFIEDKDVHLIGESSTGTIIKGNVLLADSDSFVENVSVVYKGGNYITYLNEYCSNLKLLDDAGMTAINSQIIVKNCIIKPDPAIFGSSKFGKGIQIYNLYGNNDIVPLIENCEISNADTGIYLYSQAFGGAILGEIKNNTLDSNNYGITLRMHKEKPFIRDNNITGSINGIHITYEDGALLAERMSKIVNNTFSGNIDDIWCEELGE